MPNNTVYVGRPGKWGNPFRIGDYAYVGEGGNGVAMMRTSERYAPKSYVHLDSIEKVLELYKKYLTNYPPRNLDELRGKNLACFCKEGEPCHADILLKIANQ
jgi:hypothetical protein